MSMLIPILVDEKFRLGLYGQKGGGSSVKPFRLVFLLQGPNIHPRKEKRIPQAPETECCPAPTALSRDIF